MSNYNEEYYIIGMSNNGSYPHLDGENRGMEYYYKREAIEKPKKMKFKLGYPIPRKPKMVDYHPTPYTVISPKIQEIIESFNLKGVQLLPLVIKGKNDELYKDYKLIHIYNIIPALDKGKSDFKWVSNLNIANPIRRLRLKEKVLDEISLDDRLLFRLEENTVFELYHKKIVDTIMATNPEGLQFTKVEDWHI